MNNATRLNRLEVLEEVKLPFADGSAVVSPDAAEAAGETPTKAEFDAAVALLNELKEKFNDLVAGFGGPEPPPTPNKAPEPKETLIKGAAPETREEELPGTQKDTEPEEAGEPELASEQTGAEEPETGDPEDEAPETEDREAGEPAPEEEQAEAEAESEAAAPEGEDEAEEPDA